MPVSLVNSCATCFCFKFLLIRINFNFLANSWTCSECCPEFGPVLLLPPTLPPLPSTFPLLPLGLFLLFGQERGGTLLLIGSNWERSRSISPSHSKSTNFFHKIFDFSSVFLISNLFLVFLIRVLIKVIIKVTINYLRKRSNWSIIQEAGTWILNTWTRISAAFFFSSSVKIDFFFFCFGSVWTLLSSAVDVDAFGDSCSFFGTVGELVDSAIPVFGHESADKLLNVPVSVCLVFAKERESVGC